MKIVGEEVDKFDPDYAENYEQMQALNSSLDQITAATLDVGQRQREISKKRDKLIPRERINAVLDKGSPFLEIGQLAGYDYLNPDESVPSGNIIAGIGQVGGKQCMVVANNFTFKGGAYYPITVKKHLRAQEIAEENNLPCVYLVDSAGAFLPKQDDVFVQNHATVQQKPTTLDV